MGIIAGAIGVSSNGRTRDFGSLYHGSNPCAPTTLRVCDASCGGPHEARSIGEVVSPEVLTKGDLPRGMKRSGINRLRCYPTSPPCGFVGQARISRCSGIFYFVLFARIYAILRFLADCFTYSRHNFGHRKYVCMRNPFVCFTL